MSNGIIQAIIVTACLAAVAASWLVYTRYAPDQYDITAPIDLTAPPTFVTEIKLRMGGDEACFSALTRASVRFERLPDEVKGENCAFDNVARLDRSAISWGGDVTLRCPMLAGIVMWERHILQPLAAELFNARVARVRHFGTYSCRNINNAAGGRRSQHAFANAVDVAGFVLENGEEISVLKDWDSPTTKGEFLSRIHDRACGRFNTVLGPDYNALHRDHFHFDNGGFRVCR